MVKKKYMVKMKKKKSDKKIKRGKNKIAFPILKEKKICYLCRGNKNLTYHHIIPKRELIFNGYDNIMILCRKCHNIIDVSKKNRTIKCCEKNKIIIDKYNKYLKKNLFPEDLLWELYEKEIIIEKKPKKKKGKRKIQGNGLNKNGINLNEYRLFSKEGKLDKLLCRKSKL